MHQSTFTPVQQSPWLPLKAGVLKRPGHTVSMEAEHGYESLIPAIVGIYFLPTQQQPCVQFRAEVVLEHRQLA